MKLHILIFLSLVALLSCGEKEAVAERGGRRKLRRQPSYLDALAEVRPAETRAAVSAQAKNAAGADNAPAAAVALAFLGDDSLSTDQKVQSLRERRGEEIPKDERAAWLDMIEAGKPLANMSASSMHWLVDEMLSNLRGETPQRAGLAKELAVLAARTPDPVLRDYLMQHLGHLWEQGGKDLVIESALWQGLATQDETTPGTALIALRDGYQRDQNQAALKNLYAQATELAHDAQSPLATRVTALSLAKESHLPEITVLCEKLRADPSTPYILKQAASNDSPRANPLR